MKKKFILLAISLMSISIVGNASNVSKTKKTVIKKTNNTFTTKNIKEAYIYISGLEGGPAVSKIIVELDKPLTNINKNNWKIKTQNETRKIKDVYISTKNGEKSKKSNFVTFDLIVETKPNNFSYVASPFFYNLKNFFNEWQKNYIVSIENNNFKFEKDLINNRIMPDASLFSYRSSVSGTYQNQITKENDNLTLQLAAYEPKNLKKGAKKPLIIWLHGQGEGGTDPDISILGTETAALAKPEIQSYFLSGAKKEKGAFVLVPQAPTYWMDEGDGTNGNGSGISRYTELLKKAIDKYVADNPYVDKNRIYIGGDSNGGYMTMNMIIEYPEYFAAAFPVAEAYSFYEYEKNENGTYKKITENIGGTENYYITDKLWFTNEKAQKIKNIPIWFINSHDDNVVTPKNYSLPTYQALLKAGAKNAWYSDYESVIGTDIPNTKFMGHFSWVYILNNQVSGVQDKDKIINSTDKENFGFEPSNSTKGGAKKAVVNGKTYNNFFQWLNDQKKK